MKNKTQKQEQLYPHQKVRESFKRMDEVYEEVRHGKQETQDEKIKSKLMEITTAERVDFLYAVGNYDLLIAELYGYFKQLL